MLISIEGFIPFLHRTESEDKGTSLADRGISSSIPLEPIRNHLVMESPEYMIRSRLSLLLALKWRFFLNFVARESGTGEGLSGSLECRLCGGI